MSKQPETIPQIPSWIVWVQCICFSVLYAIWALPETILIRHICLITGALLSLWTIYQYRHSFFHRRAIPVWLIVALFAWATFHLFFLANDFAAQYEEYTSIWKRTAIGAIFGLGLGISLRNIQVTLKRKALLFWMLYCSFLMPALIYSVKYLLTHYGIQVGWAIPNYWRLYPSFPPSPYYLPKTVYICFCLPALAICLGLLRKNIKSRNYFILPNAIYLLTFLLVNFVFYKENIKIGLMLSFMLAIIFLMMIIFGHLKIRPFNNFLMAFLVTTTTILFLLKYLEGQLFFQNLLADFRIATATEEFTQWRYGYNPAYPLNELGLKPSISFYERVAWFKEGVKLILYIPFGYGLVEQSFGHFAKQVWPSSSLTQAHSGWVDLTLGIGIPGVALMIIAIILIIALLIYDYQRPDYVDCSTKIWLNLYSTIFICILLSYLGVWVISELSQKVFFDNLIFWIAISAGFILKINYKLWR